MKSLNFTSQTIIHNLAPIENQHTPWALILVGLPGSGKTTFVNSLLAKYPETHIASTDNLLEDFAKERGITYSEAFKTNTENLQTKMFEQMGVAINQQKDIIVDQTNMNSKSRKSKIDSLKRHGYTVIALYFEVDSNTLSKRLKERGDSTGKVNPQHVLESMSNSFQYPSYDEGFELVINVKQ